MLKSQELQVEQQQKELNEKQKGSKFKQKYFINFLSDYF